MSEFLDRFIELDEIIKESLCRRTELDMKQKQQALAFSERVEHRRLTDLIIELEDDTKYYLSRIRREIERAYEIDDDDEGY